ncbi:iron complex outermembrane recepter protein [Fontimonas thermophila]|uniref:Iron complex outermembrane recepter protein n=1 Tax=Fontimonas thermophila TaxID=1076937 RepID=A0A1I2KP35_9GAMM|nr:TonB-dependent receptor [Fontimonas thermophila]SFF68705.1 iron complex outermembrane recepter protein [Fontimonas thermophila]
MSGALPVSVIDRQTIETSGFTSLGELLRNTVFNSTGAFRAQSGSSAQSLVAVDLRGLGSERTLVLIDGRRAPKAPFAPTAQDLNAVPLAAIERIEILKDGASAVYGSDAIGGVINIITRKDFQGVEISHQLQGTARKGGDVEQGSVTIGMNGQRGNLIVGASYFHRDIIFARDSLLAERGASFFSNNLIFGVDTNDDNVTDEYVYAPVPGGCPNSDPAFYIAPTGLCAYDFNLVAADEAETQNQGLFARGVYEITNDWRMTVNASINRAKSFGRYAPSLNDIPLTVPLDNPFLDLDALGYTPGQITTPIYLYHRFASLGNRDTTTDANVYDLTGIFSGRVLGIADVNVGARYNEYKYFETGRFFLALPVAQSLLDNGTYDFRDPNATPPEAVAPAKTTTARESTWITREAFTDVQVPMFSLPGGEAKLLVGFEYREEDYSDLYDAQSEAGNVGGSAGNSAGLDRRVRAFFSEALFPVLSNLEITAAVRRDDYSDYGADNSPKVGIRYQPLDKLTLRASWGEGFRAPTLDILSQKPAFSAEPITNDQPTCEFFGFTWDASTNTCRNGMGGTQSIQVNATQISNPDLSSEQSEQYSLGFAYDVTEWFDFSLDYYNIKITDRIDVFSPEEILDALRVGDPVPSAFVVERGGRTPDDPLYNPNARITNITFGFANSGELETNGLDFESNLRFNLGQLGNLKAMARYVKILEFSIDNGRDLTGDPGVPDTRATAAAQWDIWDFAVTWNTNLIGDQAQAVGVDPGTGGIRRTGHIGTYITHDLQVAYTAPWNATITVGAINLFDKEPSAKSALDGRDYNFALYDQYGRQPYIRYTQRF